MSFKTNVSGHGGPAGTADSGHIRKTQALVLLELSLPVP